MDDAGALILDQLSIAERRNRQAIFAADASNRYTFSVDEAAYQATIGEPPSTAAFRASLKLTSQYADLLVTLTSGQGVNQAAGDVFAMADSLENLLGLARLPALSGLGLGVIARKLEPLVRSALQQRSVAEARRLANEGGPVIIELISALVDATPAMFNVIITDLRRDPTASSGRDAKVQGYRTALSNFVVLLRSLQETFADLQRAFNDRRGRATLAELVRQTAMLEANVAAARAVFASIR